MAFPLTLDEYLYAVAKETARLSWPGRMHPILVEGAKRDAEKYFTSDSFRPKLTNIWTRAIPNYDSWHRMCVSELAKEIQGKVTSHNRQGTPYCPETVAAKLMDAFMYQLMKYQESRYLWECLHLLLDGKIFAALRTLTADSCVLRNGQLGEILRKNPYTITLEEYQHVQEQLRKLIRELNCRPNMEFKLTSPIQLNLLWADGHRS